MKNNWRQKLHLEPKSGWLNDPNGLSWFNGCYHVYFQYAPDDPCGDGDKCWGHWCSTDMLRWTYTGTVLVPDIPEDRNGVYSGSGIAADDMLHLFYTGNVKEDGDHDYVTSGRGANVITVTTSDGHNMSEKKVVLRNQDYPDYCSCHVRDPKVWKDGNIYRMVLGARTLSNEGCVLMYKSSDLNSWEYDHVLGIPDMGYMWECPDFFTIGSHSYLSVSPQGLAHEEMRFQNVYSSGYFRADGELTDFTEWDCGFDFYAPQTFETPDGRRILIGWMGIGDIPYTNPTVELGWQHCLTVPREVTAAKDGSLLQLPVREMRKLRRENRDLENGMTTPLPFELVADTDKEFTLNIGGYLTMSFVDGVFTLRFTDDNASGGRTVRKAALSDCKELLLLADTSSIEVYLNGGEKVLSTRFYPSDTEVKLEFSGMSGILYELDALEVKLDEQ
ncbi:MAG: glycoside hydrolase family 32 protein [Ruminococcus sp.]|uniref:glycoside hydrolase family 32 protein n=1 Tax=Ruminococcus sp. TaxID=41978 RepID=UPI0025F39C36|nr:glycoside hydrolase family 32 protein [Ruminococcus sp.]MCR5601172.1 glycoside hydrolase family 32 protein [Ruminococcus sp.]